MSYKEPNRYLLTLPTDHENNDSTTVRQRPPSPLTTAMNNLNIGLKPRKRKASSFKRPKTPNHSMYMDMDDTMRPRTCSMPSRNNIHKPNIPLANLNLHIDQDVETYTLRSFKMTSKGIVVNRGDSLMSRSTNSILSSGSDIYPLSVSSSSRESIGRTSPVVARATGIPYRILVLGAAGVGKTALTQQFMTSEYLGGFDTSIDAEQERTVSVLLSGEESTLYFIDSTDDIGEPEDYVGIDGYLVVYACDDRETFHQAVDILYMLRKQQQRENAVIFVGNKSDLVRSRCVTTEEAKSVAVTYDSKFIETSVVLNVHVDELLVGIVKQIRRRDGNASGSGCASRSKALLKRIFKKENLSKSCENLYL